MTLRGVCLLGALFASGCGSARTISKHSANVGSIALSPDGTLLATHGLDGAVKIWDVAGGREIDGWEVYDTGPKRCAFSFSPDGRFLAVGTVGRLDVWDASSRRRQWSSRLPFLTCVDRFAWSRDGRRLAHWADQPHEALLWDARSGIQVGRMYPFYGPCLALSHDGSIVATGERSGIVLYDLRRGEPSWSDAVRMDTGGHPLAALAFGADGKTLYSSTSSGTFAVWDLESQKRTHGWEVGGAVTALDWGPDPSSLVLVDPRGDLRILHLGSGKIVRWFDGPTEAPRSLSRTGGLAAVGGRGIHVWKIASRKEIRTLPCEYPR